MSVFKYAYNQSEKGIGKAILFGFIMGLLFALSILVILLKTMSTYDDKELKNIADETGCKIVNYELTCDKDYYEGKDYLIDLNYTENSKSDKAIIFAQKQVIFDTQTIEYKTIMGTQSDFDVNDLNEFISSFISALYVLGFIGGLIGGTIFYLLANFLLALVMMGLINSTLKTSISYQQMYKLTIFTSLPYVAFNSIIRMIFNARFIELLLPTFFGSTLLAIIFDYAVIFALTYFAVKKGYEPTEEVVNPPFEVLQDERY